MRSGGKSLDGLRPSPGAETLARAALAEQAERSKRSSPESSQQLLRFGLCCISFLIVGRGYLATRVQRGTHRCRIRHAGDQEKAQYRISQQWNSKLGYTRRLLKTGLCGPCSTLRMTRRSRSYDALQQNFSRSMPPRPTEQMTSRKVRTPSASARGAARSR